MTVARVLIIAGSDSSGGAGIEADSRVLAAHGVYSMTATTALTIQNTLGVQDVVVTPSNMVGRMIRANLDDIGCDAVKIGMLASAKTVEVVADTLRELRVETVILDPVMVSTSGSQLLPPDAVRNLREKLVPQATVLTPNIPEATLLLRDANIAHTPPNTLDDLKELAKKVHSLGAKAVLLKGGHIPLTKSYTKAQTDDEKHLAVDILYDGETVTTIESAYLTSTSTHGTGCSLASAIAAHLSQGVVLESAVRRSIRYVSVGIQTAPGLGHGSGPINHFHTTSHTPFSRGHFVEYVLSRPDVRPIWEAFTTHAFPTALGRNTLPLARFKAYLVQDYKYLFHFARTHALAASKAPDMATAVLSASQVAAVETEMALHRSYCLESFDLSASDLESASEGLACVAYSRYVLDVGHTHDWLALQVALLPCLLGYRVVAQGLAADPARVEGGRGNLYWRWVENYAGPEYGEAVERGVKLVEDHVATQSAGEVEELVRIFVRATELEVAFWDEAMGE